MNYHDVTTLFFAGALLCNCLPHLVQGLRGRPFPTPFAKPRGVGDSTPAVNVGWGLLNLLVSGFIFSRHVATLAMTSGLVASVAGWLVMAAYLLVHFGKVYRDRRAAQAGARPPAP